jgi:hypothetical protein
VRRRWRTDEKKLGFSELQLGLKLGLQSRLQSRLHSALQLGLQSGLQSGLQLGLQLGLLLSHRNTLNSAVQVVDLCDLFHKIEEKVCGMCLRVSDVDFKKHASYLLPVTYGPFDSDIVVNRNLACI